MKKLVKVDKEIPWQPKPGEGRLYIADEMPLAKTWATAFGFVFRDEQILLTKLKDRDWDIPGGHIDDGETPAQAAIREVWEETAARVKIVELIGIQELELFHPKPESYKWPYPINTQMYFLCQLIDLEPFEETDESYERRFFSPEAACQVPTMRNHEEIYKEALHRIRVNG